MRSITETVRGITSLNASPGALFDRHGYLLFQTEAAFLNCADLSIGEHVNIRGGIASISGYRRLR